MANYADYVKVQGNEAGGIDNEILDSNAQQEARLNDATHQVDWQQRYGELEKLNSRQAQTLGDYRKTIDEFITSPTQANDTITPEANLSPITVDELYDDPNAALNRAVESHPAIQEARELKQFVENGQRQAQLDSFAKRHEDYNEIATSPEFQNWVVDNPTRADLFQRGNDYDFSAADALISLYKAEQGMSQVNNAQNIAQAELVSSSGELTQEPPQYSRSEYINKLKRSRQGDLDCEAWVTTHAANYRMALTNGNVRD
jgi:hypothetical protein